jgi:peptidoglycan hydrolase CwlO-like protein
MAQSDLFSREAWMAFLAHATMAIVVVAPIGYTLAKDVAQDEADRAVRESSAEITPQLQAIREKQARFEADIEYIRLNVNDVNTKVDRILNRMDRIYDESGQPPRKRPVND